MISFEVFLSLEISCSVLPLKWKSFNWWSANTNTILLVKHKNPIKYESKPTWNSEKTTKWLFHLFEDFIPQLLPEIKVTWVRWGVRQSISSQEKGTDAANSKELKTLPLWESSVGRAESSSQAAGKGKVRRELLVSHCKHRSLERWHSGKRRELLFSSFLQLPVNKLQEKKVYLKL